MYTSIKSFNESISNNFYSLVKELDNLDLVYLITDNGNKLDVTIKLNVSSDNDDSDDTASGELIIELTYKIKNDKIFNTIEKYTFDGRLYNIVNNSFDNDPRDNEEFSTELYDEYIYENENNWVLDLDELKVLIDDLKKYISLDYVDGDNFDNEYLRNLKNI